MWLWRKLQRLTTSQLMTALTHFELLTLPVTFDVDADLLEKHSRKLLGEWHPDRFAAGADLEKRQAVQMTSLINEAVEVLEKPLSRAGYLLSLKGVDTEKFSQQELTGEFLFKQMSLRDQLEQAEAEDNEEALEQMKLDTRQWLDSLYQAFREAFEAENYSSAKSSFHQLQFVEKLLAEIDQVEERLLDY